MKTYGGSEVIAQRFLTSTLAGDELSASRPGRFTTGERAPGSHWLGGSVGPRACLEAVEKRKISCLFRESNPNPPQKRSPVTIPNGLSRFPKMQNINTKKAT
jgi:hypothetical protein